MLAYPCAELSQSEVPRSTAPLCHSSAYVVFARSPLTLMGGLRHPGRFGNPFHKKKILSSIPKCTDDCGSVVDHPAKIKIANGRVGFPRPGRRGAGSRTPLAGIACLRSRSLLRRMLRGSAGPRSLETIRTASHKLHASKGSDETPWTLWRQPR